MANTILAAVVAVAVFACLWTADVMFDSEYDGQLEDGWEDYLEPGIVALICGAIQFLSPILKAPLALVVPVFIAVMVGVYIWLCRWWHEDGNYAKEMIPFIIAAILFQLPLNAAVKASSKLLKIKAVEVIPPVTLVIAIGFMVVSLFQLRYELGKSKGDDKINGAMALATIIATGAIAIALSAHVMGGQQSARKVAESAEDAITAVQAETKVRADEAAGRETEEIDDDILDNVWDGVHFYNSDLQDDGKSENDFNFGPNPWSKGHEASYYASDFTSRRAEDPALLAATCVALDCTLGTDYIGEILYEGYEERLNVLDAGYAATRVLATDEDIFERTKTAVNKLLSSAESAKLKKMSGIEDQLFMNPATISGIPALVFYSSDFDEGWCLVYTFRIKSGSDTKAKIAFHIPCGYQWCNAAEKLEVKERESSSSSSRSSSSSSSSSKKKKSSSKKKKSSNKEKSSDKSSSKKTSKKTNDKIVKKNKNNKIVKKKTSKETSRSRTKDEPSYDKDPNKAPKKNTEPNDDSGPGEDTNSGGDKSTKDQDTNSTSKKSYEDYKEDIQETKKTNEEQKKGGDSNEPSTKPSSSNTHVDNNGDSGTGHGGADKPSSHSEKPKETKNDSAGDAWDGPSD